MKRNITIILCILVIPALLRAQDSLSHKKPFLSINGHYGFIVAHHQNMEYLIKKHIGGGELGFTVQTTGEKKWERIYKYPEKGLGVYFAELGNPEQLGQAIGFFPFINFPLNPGRKFKLFVRAGDGIGIITKPYDRLLNHKNNINGSMLNVYIHLRMYSVFYPLKNVRMESGIGLTHLSNGNFAVPNFGINLATLNLGFSIQKPERQKLSAQYSQDTTSKKIDRKYFCTLITTAGVNETNYRNGKKYGTYSLIFTGFKTVSPKSRFSAGVDLYYDFSNIAKAKEKGTFDTSNELNNLQAGFRLGYEMIVGKIGMPIEMGHYFFSKTTMNGPLYHRVGLRFYMNRHLILNYTLKTHWATAENNEIGIGYRF